MDIAKPFRGMPAAKRRAGKAIIAFFALMAAFTVLSRGLDSFTVARVAETAPSYGSLAHEITLDGRAEPLGVEAVSLPGGFAVKEILIREGMRIGIGDPVAVLDTAQIEARLAAARRELEAARLDLAAKNVGADVPARDNIAEAKTALLRAREDALAAEEAAAQQVERARGELAHKRNLREELRDSGEGTDEQADAARYEVVLAEQGLAEAELAYEAALTGAARAVEDAESAVEEAIREEEEAALTKAAEIESRRLASGRDGLTVTEAGARVAELEALLAAGGRVTAAKAGLVTALALKAGDVTAQSGAYLLAGEAGGLLFTAEAGRDDAERLAAGDRVELRFAGHAEAVSAAVSAVRAPEEAGGAYHIEALLPDIGVAPGSGGTLAAVKRGEESTLVPLTALYSTGNEKRGYVFLLRERQTTMGAQTVAERLDVEILDRGGSMAAVSGSFSPDDKIAASSSRPLADGDRVRRVEA